MLLIKSFGSSGALHYLAILRAKPVLCKTLWPGSKIELVIEPDKVIEGVLGAYDENGSTRS